MSFDYPEGMAEKCRVCPDLQPGIAAWRELTAKADQLVNQSMEISPQALAVMLPEEVVMKIGNDNELSLDPAIEGDRLEAVKLIQGMNGHAFEVINEQANQQAERLVGQADLCEGKGPFRVRIPLKGSKAIVSLCNVQLHIAWAAPPDTIVIARSSITRQ